MQQIKVRNKKYLRAFFNVSPDMVGILKISNYSPYEIWVNHVLVACVSIEKYEHIRPGTESDGDIEDYILCIIVSDQCEQIVKNIGCSLARCKLHLSLDCIGAIDGIDVQKGSSEDISNKHVLTRINFANVRCTRGGQKKSAAGMS